MPTESGPEGPFLAAKIGPGDHFWAGPIFCVRGKPKEGSAGPVLVAKFGPASLFRLLRRYMRAMHMEHEQKEHS